MKSLLLIFLLSATVLLADDPFQIMQEEKKEIRQEDVASVSIRFSLKKSFSGIIKPIWVSEELHLSDTDFGIELIGQIFIEKEMNFSLIDSFYIGEPALAFIILRDRYGFSLIDIPVGIHTDEEEIEASMFTTKATQKVYRFLNEHRPEAISDYILQIEEERQKMENISKNYRAQPAGAINSKAAASPR